MAICGPCLWHSGLILQLQGFLLSPTRGKLYPQMYGLLLLFFFISSLFFPFHFLIRHTFLCGSFLKVPSCPTETGFVDELPNFPSWRKENLQSCIFTAVFRLLHSITAKSHCLLITFFSHLMRNFLAFSQHKSLANLFLFYAFSVVTLNLPMLFFPFCGFFSLHLVN